MCMSLCMVVHKLVTNRGQNTVLGLRFAENVGLTLKLDMWFDYASDEDVMIMLWSCSYCMFWQYW